MPYRDKEVQKQAQREYLQRKRGIDKRDRQEEVLSNPKPLSNPVLSNPPSIPLSNPETLPDWANRDNYPACYLAALDKQGGKLTEASRVAMTTYKVDEDTKLAFIRRHGLITGKVMEGPQRKADIDAGWVTDYPPLVEALADPERRKRLRATCDNLKAHTYVDLYGEKRDYLSQIRYGIEGPTFEVVEQCLECLG